MIASMCRTYPHLKDNMLAAAKECRAVWFMGQKENLIGKGHEFSEVRDFFYQKRIYFFDVSEMDLS